MSSFKFGQIKISFIYFHKQGQVIAIDSNWKDWQYIVGYQVETGKRSCRCLSRHQRTYLAMVYLNTTRTQLIQCHSMFLRHRKREWDWGAAIEKMHRAYKGVGKYIHVKLKTWKERIRTNYHSQDVPHDTYCNAKAVLKIECVYKQNKKNHPQLYVEKCKYTNAEGQKCNMLDNSDDDGCFEEWNRTWTGVSYIRHTTICEDKSLLPS